MWLLQDGCDVLAPSRVGDEAVCSVLNGLYSLASVQVVADPAQYCVAVISSLGVLK